MRSVAAAIETELAKATLFVVEMVDIDFGTEVLRIANREIDPVDSFNNQTYEARVVRLGELPFTVGADEDKAKLVVDNSDLFWTNRESLGKLFEGARVTVHRMFDNLAPPNNVIQNYWHGRVIGHSIDSTTCTLELSFGHLELSRQGGRELEHTCNHLFADGLHCPYAPLSGIGLPRNRLSGAATGGSSTTLVDTGKDFVASGVEVGWLVFNRTKTSIGQVTAVAATTLTVASWSNGNPVSTNAYFVGPAFESCAYTKGACVARGMSGVNDKQAAGVLNTVKRRFFAGLLQPADVLFRGKETTTRGRKPFTRTAQGNESIDGQMVPIIFGRFRAKDMLLVARAAAGKFMHALYIVGEGRCHDISAVLVDGVRIDNVDRTGAVTQQESLMKWGFDADTGANDSSAVPSELTLEQQKRAVGVRQSRAVYRASNLDTYADNPFLFNNSNGDGVSPASFAMIRARVELEGGASVDLVPAGSGQVVGLKTLMPPSSSPQEDDSRVTNWTKFPNHVQCFYHLLRDTRYGAGLDDNEIDLAATRTESDYCQAILSTSQSQFAKLTGTVGLGPDDGDTTTGKKNFIWVRRPFFGLPLEGGILRITQAGKEFAATIAYVEQEQFLNKKVRDSVDLGGGWMPSDGEVGQSGAFIYIEGVFPAGKIPTTGDTFEIIPGIQGGQVRRFKANGMLDKPMTIGKMLQSVLDNCLGTFIQDQGKIRPVIRKAVNLTTAAQTVFTDKGDKRNVVYSGSKSTMKWNADRLADTPTSLAIEYVDAQHHYRKVKMVIKDEAAQKRLGTAFGEKKRDKRETGISLNLTSGRDQAARIGAVLLRERGQLPGGRPNGEVTWVSPVHDAIKLQPERDVVAVASDHLPAHINFVRIKSIEDNPDKATVTITARPHFNEFYDDTADDLDIDLFPTDSEFPDDETPLQVVIESVTEKLVVDQQGKVAIQAEVKVTLP